MSRAEEFYTQLREIVMKYHVAPDPAPFIQIVKIGERLAQRHLQGQAGAAMDKDAQLLLDLMGDLPDELRILL